MSRSTPDDPPIDVAALHRSTLGDHSLCDEVLGLFIAQVERTLQLLLGQDAALLAAQLHTLIGASRAIGAKAAADAAARLEATLRAGRAPVLPTRSQAEALRVTVSAAARHAASLRSRGSGNGLAKAAESR